MEISQCWPLGVSADDAVCETSCTVILRIHTRLLNQAESEAGDGAARTECAQLAIAYDFLS